MSGFAKTHSVHPSAALFFKEFAFLCQQKNVLQTAMPSSAVMWVNDGPCPFCERKSPCDDFRIKSYSLGQYTVFGLDFSDHRHPASPKNKEGPNWLVSPAQSPSVMNVIADLTSEDGFRTWQREFPQDIPADNFFRNLHHAAHMGNLVTLTRGPHSSKTEWESIRKLQKSNLPFSLTIFQSLDEPDENQGILQVNFLNINTPKSLNFHRPKLAWPDAQIVNKPANYPWLISVEKAPVFAPKE